MTSSKPYFIRAIYDWITDNNLTPYLLVDATKPRVSVPDKYIEDGQIVLNISATAISRVLMSNEAVQFDAKFSGVIHHIYVPVKAVKAIYAFENEEGMFFDPDSEDGDGEPPTQEPPVKRDRGFLKVVE